jgi:hypothetical protein
MAWTNISNGLVAVGAKPFATTIQALRDNPIAIAEGATGAPRVEGRALDTYLGTVAWSTSEGGFVGLDRCELVVGWVRAIQYGARTLRVRYTNDNGANWGSWQNVAGLPSQNSRAYYGHVILNLRTGLVRGKFLQSPTADSSLNAENYGFSVTVTPLSGCNGFQFSYSAGGGAETEGDFYVLGGLTA